MATEREEIQAKQDQLDGFRPLKKDRPELVEALKKKPACESCGGSITVKGRKFCGACTKSGEDAKMVCAELYQLLAAIAFTHPHLIPNAGKWLDNAAQHTLVHCDLLPFDIGDEWVADYKLGTRWRIDHDGFQGTVIGHYKREDGYTGVVMQQDGTKVVHVYGTKWLVPVIDKDDEHESD